MKQFTMLFMLSFFGLALFGCQEKSSRSATNNSSLSPYCQQYPTASGCPGYNGNTTSGTGTNCSLYPTAYGCPGNTGSTSGGTTSTSFCQQNPYADGCNGSTTGATTSGSTTGGTTNPYQPVSSTPYNPNWGNKYPGGVPQGSCSTPYGPSGPANPYEVRKATMTIVGKSWYNPSSAEAPNYKNTSSLLKSVTGSKTFFMTDSMLKLRFKPKPEPEPSSSDPICFGRVSGSPIAGYTKLNFTAKVVGVRGDNSTGEEPLGTFNIGVNNCSTAIDLSSYRAQYPKGLYLVVSSVKGNKAFFPNNYNSSGFRDVNSYVDIRTSECWSMDLEVAADGTKTFD